MNPAIRGYFRISTDCYGIISELRLITYPGLRDRHLLAFQALTWANESFTGPGTALSVNQATEWYVPLDDREYGVEELEKLAITKILTESLDTSQTLRKARQVAKPVTVTVEEGSTLDVQVTLKSVVERFTRNQASFQLKRQTVRVVYEARVYSERGEEAYSDTLSYNSSNLLSFDASLSLAPLYQRCAEHFLKRHYGVVTR